MQKNYAAAPPPYNLNACTFTTTGRAYQQQYWKRCLDCSTQSNVGACLNCIAVCHAGHRIDPTLREGKFFCDCGATRCKLTSGIPTVAPIRHLDPVVPHLGLEDDGLVHCYTYRTNGLEKTSAV